MSRQHPLRDRTRLTRLLILKHLFANPKARLREIAETIGVTPQAVSEHVRRLVAENEVEVSDGSRRVTVYGIQHLQEGFRDLKQSVDQTVRNLPPIDSTSALAADRIRPRDPVGLFLEDGVLVARIGRDSSSTGRAVTPADPGDEVLVDRLKGVVDLEPGRIWVLRLPAQTPVRTTTSDLEAFLEDAQVTPQRVAVIGIGARVLARRLGWPVDIEFSATQGTFHAAELGLRVALLVTAEHTVETQRTLETLNVGKKNPVQIETLDVPSLVAATVEPATSS